MPIFFQLKTFGLKLNVNRKILYVKMFLIFCLIFEIQFAIWFWIEIKQTAFMKMIHIFEFIRIKIFLTVTVNLAVVTLIDVYLKFLALNKCFRYKLFLYIAFTCESTQRYDIHLILFIVTNTYLTDCALLINNQSIKLQFTCNNKLTHLLVITMD